MVRGDLLRLPKPEERDGGERLPLARDRVRHDNIVGRDAVGRRHEQRIAQVVHIAHLSAPPIGSDRGSFVSSRSGISLSPFLFKSAQSTVSNAGAAPLVAS